VLLSGIGALKKPRDERGFYILVDTCGQVYYFFSSLNAILNADSF